MSAQKQAHNKQKKITMLTRSTIMITRKTTSTTERAMTTMILGVVEGEMNSPLSYEAPRLAQISATRRPESDSEY